jgi:hypothetical protein
MRIKIKLSPEHSSENDSYNDADRSAVCQLSVCVC